VLRGAKIDGRVALPSHHSPLPEGSITFEGLPAPGPWAVVVRTRATVLPLVSYEPRARMDGGRLVSPVPLPTWLTGPVEVFAVDLSNAIERVMAPLLMEDPLDTAPLGERRPLIYVHGKDNHDLTDDHHHDSKITIWRGIRNHPDYASLLKIYKPYLYQYPTYRSTRDNGGDLVRLVEERLGAQGPGRIVVIGHSMGGLVLRQAMSQRGFGEKVGLAITSSSPHHGTIAASLVYANGRVGERIGPFWTLVLRYGASGEPDTPGLRDLAWDNFDGGITSADELRYGLPVNRELARFNADWPFKDKLVCLMGNIHNLLGHSTFFGLIDEMFRRGQESWGSRYGNADPLVTLDSGSFAGAQVRDRVSFENFDHEQIIVHPKAVAAIYRYLKGEAITGIAERIGRN
jgi:pimeloyl-ACP methyl ester carboxylesterase